MSTPADETPRLLLAAEPPARPLLRDEWDALRLLSGSYGAREGEERARLSGVLDRMVGNGMLRREAGPAAAAPFPEAAEAAPAPEDGLFDALALALNLLRSHYATFVGDRLLHGRLLEAQRRASQRYPSLLFVELDPRAGLVLSPGTRQTLAVSFLEPQRLVEAFRALVDELHALVSELVPAFRRLDLAEVTSHVRETLEPLGFYGRQPLSGPATRSADSTPGFDHAR